VSREKVTYFGICSVVVAVVVRAVVVGVGAFVDSELVGSKLVSLVFCSMVEAGVFVDFGLGGSKLMPLNTSLSKMFAI
jgi:hypothetical protein